MNKDVIYNGYSAVPSDYECPDGDLAMSLNLINENGTISGVHQPKVIMTPGTSTQKVLFIHETNMYKHYISYDSSTNKLSWSNSGSSLTELGSFYGITHCNAIGNTLLVFTSNEIHYFFWKDTAYISLGNTLPDINVSFGLVGHPRLFSVSDSSHSTFNIQFAEGIGADSLFNELSDANKTRVTEQDRKSVA